MKNQTKHDNLMAAHLSAAVQFLGESRNVLAIVKLGELEKSPSGPRVVPGSDPYHALMLNKGGMLLYIREKEKGDFKWFCFSCSDDPGDDLKEHARRLNGEQTDHFTFEYAKKCYKAMDIGGVKVTSLDGDEDECFVHADSMARYFLAWSEETQEALLWFTPMKDGGTAKQVLYVGTRIPDIEGFITEVVS